MDIEELKRRLSEVLLTGLARDTRFRRALEHLGSIETYAEGHHGGELEGVRECILYTLAGYDEELASERALRARAHAEPGDTDADDHGLDDLVGSHASDLRRFVLDHPELERARARVAAWVAGELDLPPSPADTLEGMYDPGPPADTWAEQNQYDGVVFDLLPFLRVRFENDVRDDLCSLVLVPGQNALLVAGLAHGDVTEIVDLPAAHGRPAHEVILLYLAVDGPGWLELIARPWLSIRPGDPESIFTHAATDRFRSQMRAKRL